ncbi:translation elongation factor 4 [Patescibacteria group bacterium]
MENHKIRNFCIIAHIDHGKSTLADRLLEITNTISKRDIKEQHLDQMELERERGITIKLQPARMKWQGYEYNMIDTPGHVDFTYEVSRSLAAVEGAILLVDASQGIQAQTVANVYLALEQELNIIPVINKIDLPNANIERTKDEIIKLLGCEAEEIVLASAKDGIGIEKILAAIMNKIKPPSGDIRKPPQALVFDSFYDTYKGVVLYVRMINGSLSIKNKALFMSAKQKCQILEVGWLSPNFNRSDYIEAGEIGYIATSLRSIELAKVGETITAVEDPTAKPLAGYRELKPMVYAGFYSADGEAEKLRESLEQLKLSDASLQFEPERSPALGVGFRCGFLGLLHLEIIQERLKREFDVEVVITVPSVAYKVHLSNDQNIILRNPEEMPEQEKISRIEEPWVKLDIISPKNTLGPLMQLMGESIARYQNTEYLGDDRAYLHYQAPLSSLLTDFYDKLKSVTSGYGSLNYEFIGYQTTDVIKLSILIAEKPVESLSRLVYRDQAYRVGRSVVDILAKQIPPEQYEIKVQAAIGGKIIAASRIRPLRKDVTAKLYGGDVTRKRKLLEKQKKGKARMKAQGRGQVIIPQSAYIAVLKEH